MFKTKYRVVRDAYAGYEVQRKFFWLPIWHQLYINTYPSLEKALARIEAEKNKVVWTE